MSMSPTPSPAEIRGQEPSSTIVELTGVSKTFNVHAEPFTALNDVSMTIGRGEYVAIVGKSGSGKSTLLNMITGIDRPSSGEIWVDGAAIHGLNETELAIWRGSNVGVVFQFFQLLPTLTVIENVMLPMDFCATWRADERRGRALALLDQVGISDQASKFPAALSGGQQQRAAIARALANDPSILVADEPTGNLDSQTAGAVLDLFSDLSKAGKTLLIVTHEQEVKNFVERTITIVDGRIESVLS